LSLLLRNRIQDDFASGMIKQVEAQKFGAFAEQLEFTGGILAPRFAARQRAWVLTGPLVRVNQSVPGSAGRDSDDR
jgi:hypothetical protein